MDVLIKTHLHKMILYQFLDKKRAQKSRIYVYADCRYCCRVLHLDE